MKNIKETRLKLSFTFFCLLIISFDANAYLDPGTGGLLIQSAIAGLVMVGAFFRVFRAKISEIFHNIKFSKKKRLPEDSQDK